MGKADLTIAVPPQMTPQELAALDALTPEEIACNAETDLDNPPLDDAERDVLRRARFVQAVRRARGMTQDEFAVTYGVAVNRLRGWEQGRIQPDTMALSYLATIAHEPEAVARALEKTKAA